MCRMLKGLKWFGHQPPEYKQCVYRVNLCTSYRAQSCAGGIFCSGAHRSQRGDNAYGIAKLRFWEIIARSTKMTIWVSCFCFCFRNETSNSTFYVYEDPLCYHIYKIEKKLSSHFCLAGTVVPRRDIELAFPGSPVCMCVCGHWACEQNIWRTVMTMLM